MSSDRSRKAVITARIVVAGMAISAFVPRGAAAACAPAPRAWCVKSATASLSIKESASGQERLDLAFKNMLVDVVREDFGNPVSGATRYGRVPV
jgi:hypothetical protein